MVSAARETWDSRNAHNKITENTNFELGLVFMAAQRIQQAGKDITYPCYWNLTYMPYLW
ncbi:hypothetical protein C1H46_045799 [Malus baccata]|uniref:Uncharacterized protein n=1 Tax=Malus baccata TaxID=106549 RepID=A0A540K323_MALBA|nr:hypothetical protein C1H46_045799 [Malus baccata]